MFKIERNIPLPPEKTPYPFKDLNIGDSFFAPLDAGLISAAAQYWRKRLHRRFTVRAEKNGCRVWRTK